MMQKVSEKVAFIIQRTWNLVTFYEVIDYVFDGNLYIVKKELLNATQLKTCPNINKTFTNINFYQSTFYTLFYVFVVGETLLEEK